MSVAVCEGWSEWPAPAKLNLFLHITGRRSDGYHSLQTVYHLLDWGDRVKLRLRTDSRIARIDPLPGISTDADLAVRAAHALQAASGSRYGADIAIAKEIPLGGGLGGGSSDAATVLVALNALWRCKLGVDELALIGLGLGADVPVFVRGHSAWAEGIGELLTPFELPPRWYVIVATGIVVPSADLFQDRNLTRTAAHLTIPLFVSGAPTTNAFEPVVRKRFPMIALALDWLADYGSARLSGSGGCVFAAVATREAGEAIVSACPDAMRALLVRGVNASPLLTCLAMWHEMDAGNTVEAHGAL